MNKWRETPTLYFEYRWQNTRFVKRVRTNIGRATAKKYNGDRHFHNLYAISISDFKLIILCLLSNYKKKITLSYFYKPALYFTEMY